MNRSETMRLKSLVLALAITLTFSTQVVADCFFDNKSYEEGAIVAGHICKNGEWIPL